MSEISEYHQKQMNVEDLSEVDRKILLKGFQMFRQDEEDLKPNRDILEEKMEQGKGELSHLDCHMLVIGIANVIDDKDMIHYYRKILRG